jgi:hypothetical protein
MASLLAPCSLHGAMLVARALPSPKISRAISVSFIDSAYLADALNRRTAAPGGGAVHDPRGKLAVRACRILGYRTADSPTRGRIRKLRLTRLFRGRHRMTFGGAALQELLPRPQPVFLVALLRTSLLKPHPVGAERDLLICRLRN